MQKERGGRDDSSYFRSTFDRLGGMMPSIFRGRDPFDDPFFTRPFGNLQESSVSRPGALPGDHLQPDDKSKGPLIEELDTDDDEGSEVGEEAEEEEVGGVNGSRIKRDKAQAASANPLVEHPEDQTDDHKMSNIMSLSKDVANRMEPKKIERTEAQARSVSYRRVTYGGVNGAYYTATTTRRTGNDGMVLEDSKQADKTTGQATHRISRGIHGKGHSLTRNLDSDGKVDTLQTLHNLEEDELAGFERSWNGSSATHLPRWSSGFDFHGLEETSNNWLTNRNLEFRDPFGGVRQNSNNQAEPSRQRPKKVVTINIE